MNKIGIMISIALLTAIPLYAFAGHNETQHEVKGVVQVMPAKKVGLWKINGTQVKVTSQTKIEEDECVLKTGEMAEAKGIYQGQILVARKLECEAPENDKDEDND